MIRLASELVAEVARCRAPCGGSTLRGRFGKRHVNSLVSCEGVLGQSCRARSLATSLSAGSSCDRCARSCQSSLRDSVALWSSERAIVWSARLLEGCSEELFKWEITKDPAMTRVATQLAAAWPALSASGGALRLYFLARSPFEQATPVTAGRSQGLAVVGSVGR